LESFVGKLIHLVQTAFNIMSGVTTLHEILHETKQKKEVGVIDFEKAYNKVN
jgi:fumarate reductase subunit D